MCTGILTKQSGRLQSHFHQHGVGDLAGTLVEHHSLAEEEGMAADRILAEGIPVEECPARGILAAVGTLQTRSDTLSTYDLQSTAWTSAWVAAYPEEDIPTYWQRLCLARSSRQANAQSLCYAMLSGGQLSYKRNRRVPVSRVPSSCRLREQVGSHVRRHKTRTRVCLIARLDRKLASTTCTDRWLH